MQKLNRSSFYICLILAVPFLTLLRPQWLAISGIGPNWAVLWLLPWALEKGTLSGAFAGFCLGLILDAIHIEGATQIPALILLGFWWGRLGTKGEPMQGIFNLGLLAWLGSAFVAISIWIQTFFLVQEKTVFHFHEWAFHTSLIQAIITSLLAPIVCSLSLVHFLRYKNSEKSF